MSLNPQKMPDNLLCLVSYGMSIERISDKNWLRYTGTALNIFVCVPATRGRLNIKMSSYQYRDPHVKDKTV